MAAALRTGRGSRVDAGLACHVLDIMGAVHESSAEGRHITLATRCDRPAAVGPGLPEGRFDG